MLTNYAGGDCNAPQPSGVGPPVAIMGESGNSRRIFHHLRVLSAAETFSIDAPLCMRAATSVGG